MPKDEMLFISLRDLKKKKKDSFINAVNFIIWNNYSKNREKLSVVIEI